MSEERNFNHPMIYRIGAVGLFSLFMCIMVGVCYTAFNRQSGSRGIDVSKLLPPQHEKEEIVGEAPPELIKELEVSAPAG